MGAIFRRELLAYFTTPIGYIFLAIFYAGSGLFFNMTSLSSGSADLAYTFTLLIYVLLVVIPILTMRTLSEEKNQKTDQCLLTAPVSLGGLVLGKFLAALVIFSLAVFITVIYAVVVSAFADPDWLVVIGNIVGFMLLGSAFISIGIFVSSLTENQVVSAIISFAAMLLCYLLSSIAQLIPVEWLSKVVSNLSFVDRYTGFTYGLFDLSNALFFVSVTAVFLYLTVRVLEKRRWS
ncbi:MAG: ABC transporter permease subunit [Oscillospiraceae bacterium]|nr:ABC transporter permease subunit [Oscillospiraceae bacterium]